MRSLTLVRWLGAAVAVQLLVAASMMGVGPASTSSDEPLELGLAGTVGGAGDSGNGKNNGTGNDRKIILASGTVPGLFPGTVRTLPVLLKNQNNFAVVVTLLQTAVGDASSACAAGNIRVEDFVGRKRISARSSATQAVVVRMRNDAPDECKNVTWPLTFTGSAEKP